MCVMRWLKLAERAKVDTKLEIFPIFNAERRWSQYQDPPRRLRLGLRDSPCRGGIGGCEMHATLQKVDQSSLGRLVPPQALRAGVWGL